MTTQTTAQRTRTARKRATPAEKRAAAPRKRTAAQRAPAVGAAADKRAPAAARRGRAAAAATQELRPEPRKRATKAHKRQPATRREPAPTTEPIPQPRVVAHRGRAAAPPEPPPPPEPPRAETAEEETAAEETAAEETAAQKRAEAAPNPNEGREIRLPVIGAHIPLPTGRRADPAHVLWLGGLIVAAALDVVEWPVAAALAAGTWMIERFAKASAREELQHAGARQG